MGTIRRLRIEEEGAALPAALAVTLILGLLGAGLLAYAARGTEGAERLQASQVAQEYAENGIESAQAQLEKEPDPDYYNSGEWRTGKKLRFPGDDSGSYVEVMIEPTGKKVASTDEFRIESAGHHNGTQRKLEAYILAERNADDDDEVEEPGDEPDDPRGSRLIAKDDRTNTAYNKSKTLDVLANDKKPKEERVIAVKKTNPKNGSASCSGRKCKYTPREGFEGKTDSFRYTAISESGLRDSAKVRIKVGEKDNKPPRALDDEVSVYVGKRVSFNVLTQGKNDFDPDGPNNRLRVVGRTKPDKGKLKCSKNGKCTYTASGGVGPTAFTYQIQDVRDATDSARVKIRVSSIPKSQPTGNVCGDSNGSMGMGRSIGSGGAGARAMIGKNVKGGRIHALSYCGAGSGNNTNVPSSINGYDAKKAGDRLRMKGAAKRQGNHYNLRKSGTYNIRLKGSNPVAYITLGESGKPAYAPIFININLVNYNSKSKATVFFSNPGGNAVRFGG